VSHPWLDVLDTTLGDKVCQQLGSFLWVFPVSSTNKTDRHVITEILLKVALNTINQIYKLCVMKIRTLCSIESTVHPVTMYMWGLACGKHLHDHIISLIWDIWKFNNATSYWSAWKVNTQIFVLGVFLSLYLRFF
jgi:hypothetical protein